MFSQLADSFSMDYVPIFALAAGASAAGIGVLSSAANLASAITFIPGALLAARLRARKPIVLSSGYGPARLMLVLLAIAPFLFHGAPAATLVALIIALNAVRIGAGSLANPAWTSIVADLVPAEARGRYLSTRNFAAGLCALGASPVAGWIVSQVNARTGRPLAGYQVTLIVAFTLSLGSTYAYWRIPEPPTLTGTRLKRRVSDLVGLLRRNRVFTWLAATSFLWGVACNLCGPFFNIYLVTRLGGTAASVGISAAAFAISGLIGQAYCGRLVDRRGNRWMLVLTGLMLTAFPVSWVLYRAPWNMYLTNLFSGFIWAGYNLASFNLLLELSPPADREAAIGIYQTAVAASAVVGPILGGIMIQKLGYGSVFVTGSAGRLLAMAAFILLVRPRRNVADRPDRARISG